MKYLLVLFLSSLLAASQSFPPFSLTSLKKTVVKQNNKNINAYNPVNKYNIFVNYELGMHCVGFDESYCCVIPPYNSIQAQAVLTGRDGEAPRFIEGDEDFKLFYYLYDYTYSEGNKMRFWGVAKDIHGDGDNNNQSGDTLANYVWQHLYIYNGLEGEKHSKHKKEDRKHFGLDININVDNGFTGKPLMGGYLDYAPQGGGNIVFTDSLIPEVTDVKLKLTSEFVWDALGLPLTAFSDSSRHNSMRTVDHSTFQPFQESRVQLHYKTGRPVTNNKNQIIEFSGTNPIDIPNCQVCHSRDGIAALSARSQGIKESDQEYTYWKTYHPDVTEYMARLSESMINILALHDKHEGTTFLSQYDKDVSANRLGHISSVNCADCHGDNISGNLKAPRDTVAGYKGVKAKPLSQAIHGYHLKITPLGDAAGRDASCQVCHPTHGQDPELNMGSNVYPLTDAFGNNAVKTKDLRTIGDGCFLGRDAHNNPDVKPPFFLNSIGKFYHKEVSKKDEYGKTTREQRGLYCTNCHNHLAQELYNYDDIKKAQLQTGKTLRNKSLKEIIDIVAQGDIEKFKNYYADPKTTTKGLPLVSYYTEHKSAILAKVIGKNKDGSPKLKPWNHKEGDSVPYEAVSAGDDWWLSPAEPHCADCHLAPFVESKGGKYFPMDQKNKYSLFRYSKAHGDLACQTCHGSTHGLYPTKYKKDENNVDVTSHKAALQYSPDGRYAGPVTCAACHTVNKHGVPTSLAGTKYANDYWSSVTLMHFMRNGDQHRMLDDLMERYPYKKSLKVVTDGLE